MGSTVSRLIAEYVSTGTLSDLPDRLFIGGAWRRAATSETMETFDPGLGRPFAEFALASAADVDDAVESAAKAQSGPWRRVTPAERGNILRRAAELLRQRADRFAVVETLDSGKTLAEAQGDIRSSARLFDYYAGAADKIQGDSIPLGPDYMCFTLHEPVGVTAQIIPWNYPTSTAVRGLAPALAAGCAAVVKPAETTPLTALMLAELLKDAGLPDGVCNVVTGTGPEAGVALVSHPKIDHVTFTGSVGTGIDVMRRAAANVTSVTLELGGKSPLIALADCDLDAAVDGALWAIFSNAGQVCSAGSRLVIERPIHAAFLERLVAKTKALKVGHGLRSPDVGAINSLTQLAKIERFLGHASAQGFRIAAGGRRTTDPESGYGWFFEPTIIDDVPADDICVQEEIFGPVLSVQIVDSPEEALHAANGTQYGLVAGIYTRDVSRALHLAREIDAGQITINDYWAGGVEVPFGGNRRSGFGREKGLEGLSAYCRTKSITARI